MKNTTTKKVLEKDIQLAVCDYLKLKKHFFWRQNNTPIFSGKDGAYRAMPKYSLKGIPDIIIIQDGGYVVFLEIKQPGAKLSQFQLEFQSRCKELGAEYYVITSVDQLKEIGL